MVDKRIDFFYYLLLKRLHVVARNVSVCKYECIFEVVHFQCSLASILWIKKKTAYMQGYKIFYNNSLQTLKIINYPLKFYFILFIYFAE